MSFVVRLVPSELEAGRLVGVVVAVDSGRERPVTSADELVRCFREHLAGGEAASGSVAWDDPGR
jgi:hypothetical protein